MIPYTYLSFTDKTKYVLSYTKAVCVCVWNSDVYIKNIAAEYELLIVTWYFYFDYVIDKND